ncbi:MAG: malate/lactate/ureidoglycolate dehydrogenase [Alphaproteobacteria bacterium]|jgi:uncharacterized oxidoreductase|nr:malate/lactate/ureidoglycolate dehydrogenase [Alphaproteobacteria bacterium]
MLIQHMTLRAATRAILEAAGSDGAEAGIVADHLVDAHLAGHPSHGVGMIPRYFEALHAGGLDPNQHAEVVREDGAFLVVDGCQGYGHKVALEATELAIAKAKAEGIALLALSNACHIGRVGTYGEMCAAAGLISIHFVNVRGRTPLVAPFRGTDPRLSTNPLVVAIPATDNHPAFILDMATSRIAMGKARVAMMQGRELEHGYVLDAQGRPSHDPGVMFEQPHGSLLPLGEHKGYGLAMVCELLAGVLTAGGTAVPSYERTHRVLNNMLAIVIDPAHLVEGDFMKREIDAVIDYVKASPPADPAEPVLVAGDPERLSRAELEIAGIEIEERTWEALMDAAGSVGLDRQKIAEICDEE